MGRPRRLRVHLRAQQWRRSAGGPAPGHEPFGGKLMTRAAETHRARITPAPSSHGARRRRPPLALTGVALAALLLPAVHAPHLRLVWNASASLPTGLYAIEPERSEEHTSELQSLMRTSYAVFCLKKK